MPHNMVYSQYLAHCRPAHCDQPLSNAAEWTQQMTQLTSHLRTEHIKGDQISSQYYLCTQAIKGMYVYTAQ